jgi:hypothetical protein
MMKGRRLDVREGERRKGFFFFREAEEFKSSKLVLLKTESIYLNPTINKNK